MKVLILKGREIREQELENEKEMQWSERIDKWRRKEGKCKKYLMRRRKYIT